MSWERSQAGPVWTCVFVSLEQAPVTGLQGTRGLCLGRGCPVGGALWPLQCTPADAWGPELSLPGRSHCQSQVLFPASCPVPRGSGSCLVLSVLVAPSPALSTEQMSECCGPPGQGPLREGQPGGRRQGVGRSVASWGTRRPRGGHCWPILRLFKEARSLNSARCKLLSTNPSAVLKQCEIQNSPAGPGVRSRWSVARRRRMQPVFSFPWGGAGVQPRPGDL